MSITLQPSAQLVVPGVINTPARPTEGRASLDVSRVPYAQAEVTLPVTDADLPLIDNLDPRQSLRGTLTLTEQVAGTSRAFDLAVQSRRVSRDGRTMTVGLGGDETLLQQYYPLTEDRGPLAYQDSVRSVCNYVLRQVITWRRNLIPNPSFEAGTAGWSSSASLARVASSSAFVSGAYNLRITSVGAGNTDVNLETGGAIPATAGLSYTFSLYNITSRSGRTIQVALQFFDAAGVRIGGISYPGSAVSMTAGARPFSTATAPEGTASVRPFVRVGGVASAGETFYVDAALLEESSTLGIYFDGNSYDWAWTAEWEGPPNASPSRMVPRLMNTIGADANATAYWTVTNLLTEPSHEGALGWVAGTNATPLGGAPPARSGNYAARWFSNAAGQTWMDTAGPIRVTPGRKYTVSTYMRSTSSIPGWFMVRFKNDAGVWLQQTFSPQKMLTPDYQRFVYTVTPPPGATQAMLHIGAVATAAGQGVWNDDVMFYEGEEEIPFFDGNTPNDANYTYSWSGTPQNSTSTRTPVIERPLEMFYWRPSTSAWDFLMALVGSFGYRLFCDEQRRWFLVDPNTYVLPGEVAVGSVATVAIDTIDRTDDAYCTGVSILWKWRDRWGIDQERTETAGVAGRVRTLTFDRPYPGAGLAAAVLARASGAGREHDVTALLDLVATPTMKFSAAFPGVATQRARVTAIEWGIRDGLMRVTGRVGNSVPDAPAAPTVTSPVAGRIVTSWTPPADDGGFPILEYAITYTQVGTNSGDGASGVTSPYTRNGLPAGQYAVRVTARNIYGWGLGSPATTITVT